MPVLTDSPYPFFTYAAGVPVSLSFLVLTPEAAGRSIEEDSLVEYLESVEGIRRINASAEVADILSNFNLLCREKPRKK